MENATTLILKDLATYGAHQVQWSFPSFQVLGANGITTESRRFPYNSKMTRVSPLSSSEEVLGCQYAFDIKLRYRRGRRQEAGIIDTLFLEELS